MACAWSPCGAKSVTSWKRPPRARLGVEVGRGLGEGLGGCRRLFLRAGTGAHGAPAYSITDRACLTIAACGRPPGSWWRSFPCLSSRCSAASRARSPPTSSACRGSRSSRRTAPTSSRRSWRGTARPSRATRSSGGSSSRAPRSRPSSATRSWRRRTRTSSSHGGVDLPRTFAALVTNVQPGGYAQGGSTLTQQLARAIFLSPDKTLSRKINEALVAFEIERRYSKDQILTMYANEIYLGHGNYGVEAACRYYFGKSVSARDPRRGGAARRNRAAAGGPVAVPQPRAREGPALDGASADARGRIHHRGRAAGGRRRAAAEVALSRRSRSSVPTTARRSGSTSRGPTARRISTGAACASSRRWTRSCRRGRRRRSAGACARSRGGTGSTSPATSRPRATAPSTPTSTRPGRARRSPRASA